MTDHLNLVDGYKQKTLNTFDNDLLDLFYIAPAFSLGKLSITFPNHYQAYQILKIEYKEYVKPKKERGR